MRVFTLSLPRSRTAWLAAYLNGLGIFATHDAWRYAKQASDFREIFRGQGVACNSDSTNIWFYDEIKREFPEAKFVKIVRDLDEVKASVERTYGYADPDVLDRWHNMVLDADAHITIDFDEWDSDESYRLVRYMSNRWIDPNWHTLAHELDISITQDRAFADLELKAEHIAAKLRG